MTLLQKDKPQHFIGFMTQLEFIPSKESLCVQTEAPDRWLTYSVVMATLALSL